MSRSVARVLCALLFVSSVASAQMPEGMHRYVFGLIVSGDTPRDGVSPEEMAELQRGHLANIARLAHEGKIIVAGPFESMGERRGLFIFDVASVEEAEALCASDPLVGPGYLKVELVPWWATDDLLDMAARWRAENAPVDEADDAASPAPTTPPDLDAIAKAYVTHYMAGELDALTPHLADDVHFADPTADVTGRDAVLDEWRRVFSTLTVENYTITRTLTSPRHVLVDGTVRFRQSGDRFGLAPDRSLVFEMPMSLGLTFDGARIVDHVDYLDSAEYRAQMMEQMNG